MMTQFVHAVQEWLVRGSHLVHCATGAIVSALAPARTLWPAGVLTAAAVIFGRPTWQLHKLEQRVLPWAVSGWQTPMRARTRVTNPIRQVCTALAGNHSIVVIAVPLSGITLLLTRQVAVAVLTIVVAAALATLIQRVISRAEFIRRHRSMRHELAAVTDFVALSVSAGLSVENALIQVPRYFRGVIADTIASRATGTSGLDVLKVLAQDSSDARSLLDALVVCEATGAPAAQVLHEQSRAAATRVRADALASAGRREVLMLIPIVFFVFPAVVLVAVFPGWQELRNSGW